MSKVKPNKRPLRSDLVAYFDVDSTLTMADLNGELNVKNRGATIDFDGHFTHCLEMERHKARGHAVVVWSMGGAAWAERACKILGIDHLVDVYLTKPIFLYDDLEPSEFLPKRIYHVDK